VPAPTAWLAQGLRRRLRYSPRLSRLVTSIDLFAAEVGARSRLFGTAADGRPAAWVDTAMTLLEAARAAVNERRLDDGWDYLHSAQRQAMSVLTRSEATALALVLQQEGASKLVGWRRKAAADSLRGVTAALADTTRTDERAPVEAVTLLTHVQRTLHENSHNAYLRLRLVSQRLMMATALLALVLVGLGALAAADVLADTAFDRVVVLRQPGVYATIALLGMLGALLSFSIGAMASGADRRIYELATGRFTATAARVLVGAAAALVVAVAVQSEVVGLNPEWLLVLAVAAGFSERLVKRIIESLSADAEKPAEPARPAPGSPTPGQDADPEGAR
jgi:hypothetical protein